MGRQQRTGSEIAEDRDGTSISVRKIGVLDGADLLREAMNVVKKLEASEKYLRDGLNECKQRINELEKTCQKLSIPQKS